MSLIRQLIIVFSVFFIVVFAGTLAIGIGNTRQYLEDQMVSHAQDTATSLGLSLTPAMADEDLPLMESMVNAIFDPGYYRDIVITRIDGSALIERRSPVVIEGVPEWYVSMVPLDTPWGESEITTDWRQAAILKIRSHPGYAYRDLWQSTVDTLWWFVAGSLGIILVISTLLHFLLKPLRQVESQAQAISNREFVILEHIPWTRELRLVVEAMNRMSVKVKNMLADRTELAERMRKEAYQDSLTRLDNRRSFDSRLAELIESSEVFSRGALLLIELDDFKALNDQCGYRKGDELLKATAEAITKVSEMMGGMINARISGATFAVVVDDASDDRLTRIANDICGRLAKFHSQGLTLDASVAHIGIARYSGNQSIGELLSEADTALRLAREKGPNRWVLSDDSGDASDYFGTQAWLKILRDVIDQHRLVLHFQPVVTDGGELHHYEVLARIPATDDGDLVAAGVFFPVAERGGLATELDKAIVETAVAHLAAHPEQRYAVNLSGRSVEDLGFHNWLFNLLNSQQDVARRLTIEAAETLILNSYDHATKLRSMLDKLGVGFAVDHFGVSSGSFGYLASIKPNYVKLDGNFVRDLDQQSDNQFFIQTVAGIARGLDAEFIVESVESESVWRCAKELKIDAGQGYYLGRPKSGLGRSDG